MQTGVSWTVQLDPTMDAGAGAEALGRLRLGGGLLSATRSNRS